MRVGEYDGYYVEGTITILDHCTFHWWQVAKAAGPRVVEIGSQHCDRCISSLLSLGFVVIDNRELSSAD